MRSNQAPSCGLWQARPISASEQPCRGHRRIVPKEHAENFDTGSEPDVRLSDDAQHGSGMDFERRAISGASCAGMTRLRRSPSFARR
jgi:hypothetical protein